MIRWLCDMMIFTVLGAVAELERNLIVERVRAGLRHARAKGKRLGRPRKSIDVAQVKSMRAAGASWRVVARRLGVSVGSVFAAAKGASPENPVNDTVPLLSASNTEGFHNR